MLFILIAWIVHLIFEILCLPYKKPKYYMYNLRELSLAVLSFFIIIFIADMNNIENAKNILIIGLIIFLISNITLLIVGIYKKNN